MFGHNRPSEGKVVELTKRLVERNQKTPTPIGNVRQTTRSQTTDGFWNQQAQKPNGNQNHE